MIKTSAVKKNLMNNSSNQTEKILVENFVSLQKVMVDLSEKFTNLSSQLSKLLNLFEISAKTLAEKGFEDNRDIVKKLDSLIEQNKIIAKGISLLHEEIEEPMPPIKQPSFNQTQNRNLPPNMNFQNKSPPQNITPPNRPSPVIQQSSQKEMPTSMEGYQKSISS